jgi:hypothetical protein
MEQDEDVVRLKTQVHFNELADRPRLVTTIEWGDTRRMIGYELLQWVRKHCERRPEPR